MKISNFRISQAAVTLTELLVASMLVGIVTIGVMSFYLMYDQTVAVGSDQSNLQPIGAMLIGELSKDAFKAVGDNVNRGIWTYTSVSGGQSICFRQDVNNPASYADDRWVCYSHGSSWHLKRCVGPSGVQPVVGATICGTCTSTAAACSGFLRDDYIGLIGVSKYDAPFYEVVNDANGRLKSIKFNINIMNNSNNDEPYHPVTNPKYTLTTEISPPGHSR